jgi:hypothetical protein
MIVNLRKTNPESGGVLVVTILICVLVGVMLAAYLAMVSSQHKFSQRSQVWNSCIPLCEAGIEEAMAHINHINTTSNFGINGWAFSSNAFRKDRPLNLGMARIAIDTSMPPVITVVGSLQAPVTATRLSRTVRVKTKINQRFPNGILSKGALVLNGTARVDSFNSTNVLESTNGMYSLALATDHASIVTTSKTPGMLDVGNASVYGSTGTGPGGNVLIGPNGNVGSTTFNNDPANDGKVESGHYANDVNVYIPDATLPAGFVPFVPTAGIVNGTNYTYVLGNGDWRLVSVNLGAGQKIIVTGKARILVMTTTQITASDAFIYIANGGSVEWYAAGNVSMSGGGLVNYPGFAKNFSLFGLNNCTSVSYSGSAGFCGTIYAPRAAIDITGNADVIGAFVGNTFKITGTANVHYDEALKGDPREGRFLAASWQEL